MRWILMLVVAAPLALGGCSGDRQDTAVAPDPGAAVSATETTPEATVIGSVTGSAMAQVFAPTGIGLRKLTFTARHYGDGHVEGQWNIVAGGTILHGDIDCLTILPGGTRARFSGLVNSAKFTYFIPGTAFAMEVVDSGEGVNADPDQNTELRAFMNAPPDVGTLFCETGEGPDGLQLVDVKLGNVQVHGE